MNPVDVLNLLGKHGYRVIGFTAEADQKMVWTLEQKDFENKIMDSGSDHHGHYWKQNVVLFTIMNLIWKQNSNINTLSTNKII